eukprot:scaffold3539_cov182-Cylindrotheca_fusiformis.AAC.1
MLPSGLVAFAVPSPRSIAVIANRPPPISAYQSHAPYQHRAHQPSRWDCLRDNRRPVDCCSAAFQEGETHGMCEWKWNKKRKKGNRHHGPYYVDRHGRCHHAPSRRSPKFATPRMNSHLKPSRVISSKGWKATKRQEQRHALSDARDWEWKFKTPGVEDWNWTPQKRTLYIPRPRSGWCVPTNESDD